MSSPQLTSPDGRWRWDGVRWVPILTEPSGPRPMATRWVTLIVVGSIAALLLAGTGLAALSSVYSQIGRNFGPGAQSNCLPSEFPRYPGADVAMSFHALSICTAGFTTQDSSNDVVAYFEAQLVQYPWRVTGGSADQVTINFARQDGGRGSGQVSVAQSGNPTQFEVVYQT